MQVGVKHPASLAAFSVVVGTVLGIRLSRVCALLFALPPPPPAGWPELAAGPLRGGPPRAHAGPGDRSGPDAARSGRLRCAALRCCPACCCRDAGVLAAGLLRAGSAACRPVTPGRGRCAGLPRRAAQHGRPALARLALGRPGTGRPSRDRPSRDHPGTGQPSRDRPALADRHRADSHRAGPILVRRSWSARPGPAALARRPWSARTRMPSWPAQIVPLTCPVGPPYLAARISDSPATSGILPRRPMPRA
jgi:hypothetical protein